MTKDRKVKKNSYMRMGVIMLLSAIGGGVIGSGAFLLLGDKGIAYIAGGAALALTKFQQIMAPALAAVMLASVVFGELNLRKQRMLCRKIAETEDEECDRWEYEEEKAGAYGTVANILSQILCILALAAGYSIEYIGKGHRGNVLAACIIFLACYTYDGFWQVRFVKLVQKTFPEKKGDPASRKFHQDWLESCDEAEKEVIYRASYNAYSRVNKFIPVMIVLTMLGHLFFNTGIMAIIVTALIWLVVAASYLSSCVSVKGQKLRG